MPHFFFLSDLGQGSSSLARMKGQILQDCPKADFVDLSHEVNAFEVTDGAYVLRNVYRDLPKGSVIIAYVDCYYEEPADYILVEAESRYFLAADNGILSLALGDTISKVVKLGNSEYGNWPGETFAKAGAKIAMGFPVSEVGEEIDDYKVSYALQPIVNNSLIRATVIAVDHFGNLILNLNEDTFEEARNNRRFSLHFQHDDPITFICNQYSEVEVGEVLARFNSTGLLEIAVNHGKAIDELTLKPNDLIQIDFY